MDFYMQQYLIKNTTFVSSKDSAALQAHEVGRANNKHSS